MKKKLFIIVLLLFSFVLVVNSETDFFLNINHYIPAIEEKYPGLSEKISDISEKVSDVTNQIPTPSEIIAAIKNEELPIDPSDVAVNAYITDSPMLSFFPDENISAVIENSRKLKLFGIISDKSRQHLVINICDVYGNTLEQMSTAANNYGEFTKTISLPKSGDTTLKVDIYTGSKAYGDFESWVYNYLYISRIGDTWEIKHSPVYAHNKSMYEKEKSVSEALKNTSIIQSGNTAIKEKALEITRNCTSEYEKLTAIHDWVCENIYYDTDNINTSLTLPYSASEVLSDKRAVCLGFSTLSAALCRSIGIPCNVISGYALGIGSDSDWSDETIHSSQPNHAWNEAYVDGRWVIFDTTWDCANKIEDGKSITSDSISRLYFDSNIDFFSANHKIIELFK